jgi:tetratricopeptide (TPR) repeat protein
MNISNFTNIEQFTITASLADKQYNVGVVYTEQNRPIEALTILKQALVIFEKHTIISQLNIADCYHFLGINYHNSSSFEAAFMAHQKVLVIREKLLGLNDTNTANTYLNIAVVYHEKSQYLNAFIYYQKAGLIYQKNLSPNHFFYRLLQAMYKKTLAAAKKEMLPTTIKRYKQWLKDNLPE